MLQELLPASVAVAEGEIASAVGELYPDEALAIRFAVEKRRREFQAGRAFARTALSALGWPPHSLPVKRDRTPAWPSGIVGSITHSDRYCAAAVARAAHVASIGIDIEETARFDTGMIRLICTEAEQSALEAVPAAEQQVLGTIVFSAKESFFKCQYSVTKTFLDFRAVEVRLDPPAGEFVVVPRTAEAMRFPRMIGRYRAEPGTVCTAILLWPDGGEADGRPAGVSPI
ncbi:MAG TPA: 4'-phosphopantetheinyl transferase superfamily protein [Blastocatellia bacterium]|jgi:4'-phosphopantetheinyl transferase EntD